LWHRFQPVLFAPYRIIPHTVISNGAARAVPIPMENLDPTARRSHNNAPVSESDKPSRLYMRLIEEFQSSRDTAQPRKCS
jgi:hypothetical protein